MLITASAGLILFRFKEKGGIEVLIGTRARKGRPYEGFLQVVFGGKWKRGDAKLRETALREAREETGGNLILQSPFLVEALGPEIFHSLLEYDEESGDLISVPTEVEIGNENQRFIFAVYAALITGGDPRATEEVTDFKFVDPVVIAKDRTPLAFNQAEALAKFWRLCRHTDLIKNPRILQMLVAPPV